MAVDLAKWIWNLFIIVLALTFVFVFYFMGSNKSTDIDSLEAGLLKERIKFSLETYGNLDDCILPEKYGIKLIVGDDEKIYNHKAYIKEDCTWKHTYCKNFKFEVNGEMVKLDVVFRRG